MNKFDYKLTILIFVCISQNVFAQINFDWVKQVGGVGDISSTCISINQEGSVFTTGFFMGTAVFDPGTGAISLTSKGGADIFISKLTSTGNFEWVKHIGGTNNCFGHDIALDEMNNIYIVGSFLGTVDFDPSLDTFHLTSFGNRDIFVVKLDGSGNFIWAKQMGGTNYDLGHSVVVDKFQNVYVTGAFFGTVDLDPNAGNFYCTSFGQGDIFVVKLDVTGDLLWAKHFGATGGDAGYCITLDNYGSVYLTGHFQNTVDFNPSGSSYALTSNGNHDVFIFKSDSSGNFLWTKQIGGIDWDYGMAIKVDSADNIYTTGIFRDTVDFDPSNNTLNIVSKGNHDAYVCKFDLSGNLIWARTMGGSESDWGWDIAYDNLGNVYTVGFFEGLADFDPNIGSNSFTSEGLEDIFITKFDDAGQLIWAKQIGGIDFDRGYGIAVDKIGNVFTSGEFRNTVNFNTGGGVLNLSSFGNSDAFIHKMTPLQVSIIENNLGAHFEVYPNPTSEVININSPTYLECASLRLLDILGNVIFEINEFSGNSLSIDFNDKLSGFYFVEITEKKKMSKIKVIKQ